MGKIIKNGVEYSYSPLPNAAGVPYDNTNSGLSATTVQGAVDEFCTNSYGSLTVDSTYISSVERNHWQKFGRIVTFELTCRVGTNFTSTNRIATGLPRPSLAWRFLGVNGGTGAALRIILNADGTLDHAYSTANPAAGQVIEMSFTYISES